MDGCIMVSEGGGRWTGKQNGLPDEVEFSRCPHVSDERSSISSEGSVRPPARIAGIGVETSEKDIAELLLLRPCGSRERSVGALSEAAARTSVPIRRTHA